MYVDNKARVIPINIRMQIFNNQIFEHIFDTHCIDNCDIHYKYMELNFHYFMDKGIFDNNVTIKEFEDFCDGYDSNIQKLLEKHFNFLSENELEE